jgi:hypothetical protein
MKFLHDWKKIFSTLQSFVLFHRFFFKIVFYARLLIHQKYGRIIISEVNIPDKLKTIKPVNMGGLAGGVKYCVHNILFKFPLNVHNIYSDYEAASKGFQIVLFARFANCSTVAGHELKGLLGLINSGAEGIHFPLTALLDFLGYRLLCMSMLPIDGNSLIRTFPLAQCFFFLCVCADLRVVGSADAGKKVVNKDKKVKALIEQIGTSLNLQSHFISPTVETTMPLDLEIHRGKDGKVYALDFARVFPPEYVDK